MAVSTSSANLFQPHSQQRALLACVAASIILHATVLIAFPELRGRAAPSPRVLTALLAPVAPREAAPAAEKQSTRAQPRPQPTPRPAPRPEAARSAPEPVTPSEAVHEASPPAAQLAEAAPAATAVPNEAPPQPAPAWDGATLQQYRTGLIAFARQFKRYPTQAMERGWEGRVEIRITVKPTGTIESARVKTPSGYQILDDQALDMVKRALARTPMPPALVGREFSVDIPVIFELQG
jgi:periplasmic protein TonB